jgi:2-dehydropantoate 2-reductase
MKIAIAGAGAVGNVIAAYLSKGGDQISVLVRGAHLAAIREHGLTVLSRGERLISHPAASDDASELGLHDLVIVTAKAQSLAAMAPGIARLRKPGAPVIAAQNGLPWWYFYGQRLTGRGAALSGRPLECVDPDGVAWRLVGGEETIGCVIRMAAEVASPGVVTHAGPLRLTLGAPDVGAPPRGLAEAAEVLQSAGIETIVTDHIRRAIWEKLQLNLSTGPAAVLTGATLGQIRDSEGMDVLLGTLMQEARDVAAALGVDVSAPAADWISRGGGNAGHKPSMLQDFEAGRPLELDAMVTAVVDLAHLTGVPVPTIEAMLTLVRLEIACRDAAQADVVKT